jgi:hypothetical protein
MYCSVLSVRSSLLPTAQPHQMLDSTEGMTLLQVDSLQQHVSPTPAADAPAHAQAEAGAGAGACSSMYLVPDLSGLGQLLHSLPDDKKTHPLDVVPKDDVDFCTLTVRQMLLLLQHAGAVALDDATKAAKGVAPHVAMQAIRLSCYAKSSGEQMCIYTCHAALHPSANVAIACRFRMLHTPGRQSCVRQDTAIL